MPRKGKKSTAVKQSWASRKQVSKSKTGTSSQEQHMTNIRTEVNGIVSVSASHDQANEKFSEFSRGNQCVCNALTFLTICSDTSQIQTTELDRILDYGDQLYTDVVTELLQQNKYVAPKLALHELPAQFNIALTAYRLQTFDVLSGPLQADGDSDVSLPDLATALRSLLQTPCQEMILVVHEYAVAIMRDIHSGRYVLFDSHSRDMDGLCTANGTAVMLSFPDVDHLISRLYMLCRSLNLPSFSQYDLMPVAVMKQSDVNKAQILPDCSTNVNTNLINKLPNDLPKKMKQSAVNEVEFLAHSSTQINVNTQLRNKDPKERRKKNLRRKAKSLSHKRMDAKVRKRHRYRTDAIYRAKCMKASRERNAKQRLTNKVVFVRIKNAAARMLYASNAEHKSKRKHAFLEKYASSQELRHKKQQDIQRKYAQSEEFRERQKQYIKRKYTESEQFRERQKQHIKRKYAESEEFRDRQKKHVQRNYYAKNEQLRLRTRQAARTVYAENKQFRERKKQAVNKRYKGSEEVRQKKIHAVTMQYAKSQQFRDMRKRYILQKYHSDKQFRSKHKQLCANRIKRLYRHNRTFRLHSIEQSAQTRRQERQSRHDIGVAIAKFKAHIQQGPSYVCTVCHRALFRNQVQICQRDKVKTCLKHCLIGKYVHKCNRECEQPCSFEQTGRTKEWICSSCNSTLIKQQKVPCLAIVNKLALVDIPDELKGLNTLERHVIAKFIPFAKIVNLPKGGQKGVKGSVVCVPSKVQSTVNSLPRCNNDAQFLKVKLKRKLSYTGHYQLQTLSPHKVRTALHKLCQDHSEYGDVTVNLDTVESANSQEMDTVFTDTDVPSLAANHDGEHSQMETDPPVMESDNSNIETTMQDLLDDHENQANEQEQTERLCLDTCLQPPDIGVEVMTYQDEAYCIAPAEGNKPVSCFKVPNIEAMAFPVHFPDGKNTFDEPERPVKLSLSRYFNARLVSADNRFASDTNYIFFAQFTTELQMASSKISIELRKSKPKTKDGRRINSGMLKDKSEIHRMVNNRDCVRFMEPLRGTPAYWEKTMRDLFAMLRQIGIPTFFVTFSAAEMRWPEIIQAIKAQQGETVSFDSLDWMQKCSILKSNPVTTMRMFEQRVQALMTDLIMSPARPIGEITDYFYRVEFQQRGSPHIHCLFWVNGASELDKDSDLKVTEFVDQYVTCELPDEAVDPELYGIVTKVQTHSKNHSKSCKKNKNVNCRFGFPKPPMPHTQIVRPKPVDEENSEQHELDQESAKEKLKHIWDLINDDNLNLSSVQELLAEADLSNDDFLKAMSTVAKSTSLQLKRRPKDMWVNGYNKDLLRAWNANMDIQYVLNPYSCIMYIVSYISKAEREMSDFLNTVINEAREVPDSSDHDDMKKVMQAYAKNREVSAQEAVVRTCSMKLKSSSRDVVFLSTDDDNVRLSLPRQVLETLDPDSEEVWMSGWPEKYKARPETPEFNRMCMAEFASNYRLIYGIQIAQSKSAVQLQNGLGYIQKRTKSKPAVIRFAKFSEQKYPEKYYGTLLKLYLPHRCYSQLKTQRFESYEDFYKLASVKLPGSSNARFVSEIVENNRRNFEKYSDVVQSAQEIYEQNGPPEDAWAMLAPNTEVDRLESIMERGNDNNPENEQDDVPDLDSNTSQQTTSVPLAPLPDAVNAHKKYQTLNREQAMVFYHVRNWCKMRAVDESTDPFFIFVTGGAGTGKSHLINCIYIEATKLLSRRHNICEETDLSQPSVLLTAFTGTAAFNISGKTLHRVFKLPQSCNVRNIQGLGPRNLDTLRGELCNLQILVIDEISMVSKGIFAYIDDRLKQIKGSRKPFGNVSILAVGDFYQLPPIRSSKSLCVPEVICTLWQDHFQLMELTQIMRQRDDTAFAQMLNRLRKKTKEQPLAEEDQIMLQTVHKTLAECPKDVLHIFPTNAECAEHNEQILEANFEAITFIKADDYVKEAKNSRMTKLQNPASDPEYALPEVLSLCENARVMIIRNIDVEDGLVNGAFGKIKKIVKCVKNNEQYVTKIGLELDDKQAGRKHRRNIQDSPDSAVFIERFEEPLRRKNSVRLQFPLKLAYACTIHKVQGMTTNAAVTSLQKIFASGMAYVALSRTTSLSGLHIVGLDETKIFCNPDITTSLDSMPTLSCTDAMPLLNVHVVSRMEDMHTLTVIHHNTEGLISHFNDLQSHHELKLADVLCITETHLHSESSIEMVHLPGYHLHTRNRNNMQRAGGVAIYVKDKYEHHRYDIDGIDAIEHVAVALSNMLIITIYRPPQQSLAQFLRGLKSIIDTASRLEFQQVVVCGDFNEDQLKQTNKPICNLLTDHGFDQVISTCTTERGTLLDPMFVANTHTVIAKGVLQTYYSYHNPTYCVFSFCEV